jgi:hypothetical protein
MTPAWRRRRTLLARHGDDEAPYSGASVFVLVVIREPSPFRVAVTVPLVVAVPLAAFDVSQGNRETLAFLGVALGLIPSSCLSRGGFCRLRSRGRGGAPPPCEGLEAARVPVGDGSSPVGVPRCAAASSSPSWPPITRAARRSCSYPPPPTPGAPGRSPDRPSSRSRRRRCRLRDSERVCLRE